MDLVLADIVPHLAIRSLGLIGRADCGKTPVMEGVACMFSRHWKRVLKLDVPTSYRTASDLDFFRGEVGCVDRPDGLDDADPHTITPAKFKAFTDVGLVEAMTRERWGAAKWVRNQLRLFAFNRHDRRAEPSAGDTVGHDAFMRIIEPLWHIDFDDDSKMAVVKRVCVVIITEDWCYWRVAGGTKRSVPRVKLGSAATGGSRYLLADCTLPVLDAWKGNCLVLPEDHDEHLEFEERWMTAAMSGGVLTIPRLRPAVGPTPVLPDAPHHAPQSDAPDEARAVMVPVGPDGAHEFPGVFQPQASSARRASFRIPGDQRARPSVPLVTPSVPQSIAPEAMAKRRAQPATGGRRGQPSAPSAKTLPGEPVRLGQAGHCVAGGPPHVVEMLRSAAKRSSAVVAPKVEQRDMNDASAARALKIRRVEDLTDQLNSAHSDLELACCAVKAEPPDTECSEFRGLVSTFASETSDNAFVIDDSPVRPKRSTERRCSMQ